MILLLIKVSCLLSLYKHDTTLDIPTTPIKNYIQIIYMVLNLNYLFRIIELG